MNKPALLDLETFIWNPFDFQANEDKYLSLAVNIPSFLNDLRPKGDPSEDRLVVLSDQLYSELYSETQYGFTSNKLTSFSKSAILSFLSIVNSHLYQYSEEQFIVSVNPEIKKNHFNDTVKLELDLIAAEIHRKKNGFFTFFSFESIWLVDEEEVIILDTDGEEVRIEVVLADKNQDLEDYFLRKERVFDPSDKHEIIQGYSKKGGAYVSPLSCYDKRTEDLSEAQGLLDRSRTEDRKHYYNYDRVNETWVVFHPTFGGEPDYKGNNDYHGHDISDEEVQREVPGIFSQIDDLG